MQTATTSLPPTMRALEIRDGHLHLTQLPLPQPAPGELLLRTRYIGINRADLLQVEGRYPSPKDASPLPGLEVSGTVAGIGEGITAWEIGQEACALLAGGGYAEYVAVPAGQVLPLPQTITLAQAATLPEAAATSLMALEGVAALKPGERLLYHGGTSGLGILLGQIARTLGAEVFATVSSEEKADLLRQLGITPVNHHTAPFAAQLQNLTGGAGVDVIVDTLGGPALSDHLSLLTRHGRMVTLAVMEGVAADSPKISRILTHQLRWEGAMLRGKSVAEKTALMQRVQALVWPALAQGHLKPHIDAIFPLEEAEKAHRRMQERLHLGKILLEVATK